VTPCNVAEEWNASILPQHCMVCIQNCSFPSYSVPFPFCLPVYSDKTSQQICFLPFSPKWANQSVWEAAVLLRMLYVVVHELFQHPPKYTLINFIKFSAFITVFTQEPTPISHYGHTLLHILAPFRRDSYFDLYSSTYSSVLQVVLCRVAPQFISFATLRWWSHQLW
jgi:hypothetical protein